MHTFVPKRDLAKRRCCSISTVGRQRRNGLLTDPVSLSAGVKAWPSHEIQALDEALLSGATPDQIRQLVRELMAARPVLMSADKHQASKAAQHPKLVEGREQYWRDVRLGLRGRPVRSKCASMRHSIASNGDKKAAISTEGTE